jgi:HTH-type transcriptional regulator/antitoxin HigA
LGHIYEHLINNNEAEFIDLDYKNENEEYRNSNEEKQANNFAQNELIKDEDWSKFKNSIAFKNNDQAIIAFAKQVTIHPSIVRGRVCFTLNNYRNFTSISNEIN